MRHSIMLAHGFCLASALLLGACVGGYVRVVEPTDFKATRELDVWSHGQRLRLTPARSLRGWIRACGRADGLQSNTGARRLESRPTAAPARRVHAARFGNRHSPSFSTHL